MARGDLRSATGVLFVDDPDQGQRELPTFTCPHCNRVGLVGEDGGWCFPCARLLCRGDACLEACHPFLARVEGSLR